MAEKPAASTGGRWEWQEETRLGHAVVRKARSSCAPCGIEPEVRQSDHRSHSKLDITIQWGYRVGLSSLAT